MSRLSSYLEDPVLKGMYDRVRAAGAVRPISLDLTSKCNLRCTGCYYYAEGMDRVDHRRDRPPRSGPLPDPVRDLR